MPINARRLGDIIAAVAAYDHDHPDAQLARHAARLLAAMFPSEDVCQRSLEAIAGEAIAEIDRDAVASRDRQLAALKATMA